MASSKKLAPSELDDYLQARLSALIAPGCRATLALSGGVDSVVLFTLLLRARSILNFSLSAIHVNHHLSPHAKEWAAFCLALCAEHNVPLTVKNVEVPRRSPLGLEAAARSMRYQAFAELDTEVLLLAHHLDDQVETLLLNLLRGAGVRGAAGMPESRRQVLLLARPLIDVPRASLIAYAKKHRLAWIDDESNDNTEFARNFLRHEVLPVIERRFPAYRQTLARAAQHFAEADTLLDELAAIDLASAVHAEKLRIAVLASLTPARAKNLLRAYLRAQCVPLLDTERLQEWLRQLLTARGDSRVALDVAGLTLRRYRGEAWVELDTDLPAPDWQMSWQGEREMTLATLGGKLVFTPAQGAGISVAKLTQFDVTLRLRQGGEKLKPDCKRPGKTLKHLLQEAAIPPWQRARLPLIYSGGNLVAVAGIGIDCAFHAAPDESGLEINWVCS
jgi:tRNA(Ile)-lysidine synthase